ncbi:MAG: SDR family NAD(P)-dependent oxidoreductase [Ferruginibacter sp.]
MNIIITGASKGIGRAIAAAFAAEGAELFLCARNEINLYNTVAELQTSNPASLIKAKAFDLSVKEDAKSFGTWVLDGLKHTVSGKVDVLVNNAGIFTPGSIYDEEEGLLEKMMETNVYSAYHLTRTLVPAMIKSKQGLIVNICSIASLHAYTNGGSYSITKFALMGFDKNLREELKPYHIKVMGVYPGAVMTGSWGDFDNSSQRIMEAGDIAVMILAASKLSPQAVVEDIIMRPLLGDL